MWNNKKFKIFDNSFYLISWKDFNLSLSILPENTYWDDNHMLEQQIFHQRFVPTNDLSKPGECRKLNLLRGELGHVKGLAENLEFRLIMQSKI